MAHHRSQSALWSSSDDAKEEKSCSQRIFRRKTLLKRVPVLQWLPKYSKNDFIPDLIAGITIGITG